MLFVDYLRYLQFLILIIYQSIIFALCKMMTETYTTRFQSTVLIQNFGMKEDIFFFSELNFEVR